MGDMTKTIKDHEKSGIFCPWTNKHGQCVSCMAMIEVGINEKLYKCGILYPPEKD